MSWFKKLFGGETSQETAAPAVDGQEEFEGHTIKATLMKVGGEFQIAGIIEKQVEGETKTYSFIRADKFANKDDCIATTLAKGRQIINEQGRFLFD
ncbi:HlyU family transcriptional regulator [Pelagibacterium sp.]|uniref:HlyU family transcriptional regulator n=1 Tax=Pelagibacterium sp. TaxID=1967288 RepID=UPI003A8FDFD6